MSGSVGAKEKESMNLWTVGSIADLSCCTPDTIQQLIDAGRLPATEIDGVWYVSNADFLAYLERPRGQGLAVPAV
jgi:hypothetical protein